MDKHICVMSELSSWIPKKSPQWKEAKTKSPLPLLDCFALKASLHLFCVLFSLFEFGTIVNIHAKIQISLQHYLPLSGDEEWFCALCSIPLLLGRTDSLCKASMLLNQFCPSMVLLGSLHTSQNDCHWVPCGPRLFSMRTWPGGKAMIFKSSAVSCPGWKRRKSVCLSSVLCS